MLWLARYGSERAPYIAYALFEENIKYVNMY